jgi:ATP-dependent DNA ligase
VAKKVDCLTPDRGAAPRHEAGASNAGPLPECVPIGYTASALRAPRAKTAYIDGELCALRADGVPSFGLLQAAMDQGRTNSLVFFAFDLLYLDARALRRCR